MCQRDSHRLLFTASWIWYPACTGVGACLFPCITRAVSQPARSYSVKLQAVVAQVELPHSHIAGHGFIKPVRLFLRPVRALVRLALVDLSQSISSPRIGPVHVLFAEDIVYVGETACAGEPDVLQGCEMSVGNYSAVYIIWLWASEETPRHSSRLWVAP